MPLPIEPYLAMLWNEISTTLMPQDDDNAKRIAIYAQRVLAQLLLRINTLPALQRQAIAEFDAILDELNARLRSMRSGMIITADLIRHIRVAPDYALLEPASQRAVQMLLAQPDDTSRALLKKIFAIFQRLQDGLNQASLAQHLEARNKSAAAAPALNQTQWAALQDYLRRRFTEPGLEIGKVKLITGGGSKKTLILSLRGTKALPPTLVVRADQASGVTESTVNNEYQLLETLHSEGLPVPRPFALETDGAILGGAFVVVGFIEGRNIGDHLEVFEPGRGFASGLARAMGKLHRIAPERFGDGIAGARMSTIDHVRREMADFEMVWRNSNQPSVALEIAYAWLKDHLRFSEGRRALNHCDLACHNLLAKDGELTAILDWETVIIGNPAHDLAYAYPQVIQCMPWEEFLIEYENAGGTIPGTAEFDFYRLWTACWRMSFIHIARSFFEARFAPSVVLAYGAQHLNQRLDHELHVVLNDIYSRY